MGHRAARLRAAGLLDGLTPDPAQVSLRRGEQENRPPRRLAVGGHPRVTSSLHVGRLDDTAGAGPPVDDTHGQGGAAAAEREPEARPPRHNQGRSRSARSVDPLPRKTGGAERLQFSPCRRALVAEKKTTAP